MMRPFARTGSWVVTLARFRPREPKKEPETIPFPDGRLVGAHDSIKQGYGTVHDLQRSPPPGGRSLDNDVDHPQDAALVLGSSQKGDRWEVSERGQLVDADLALKFF
jgi:hypothetical protein